MARLGGTSPLRPGGPRTSDTGRPSPIGDPLLTIWFRAEMAPESPRECRRRTTVSRSRSSAPRRGRVWRGLSLRREARPAGCRRLRTGARTCHEHPTRLRLTSEPDSAHGGHQPVHQSHRGVVGVVGDVVCGELPFGGRQVESGRGGQPEVHEVDPVSSARMLPKCPSMCSSSRLRRNVTMSNKLLLEELGSIRRIGQPVDQRMGDVLAGTARGWRSRWPTPQGGLARRGAAGLGDDGVDVLVLGGERWAARDAFASGAAAGRTPSHRPGRRR